MRVDIDAEEIYIKNLFSEKYLFQIPNFQRPFSWTVENFDQLFEDLKDAKNNNQEIFADDVQEYEPYFIGSIILCTDESRADGSGVYDIIDGQQRLTSLVILMAVLRDLAVNKKAYDNLSEKIYQEEDEFAGTSESIRLKVREKEKEFFKKNILKPGSTKEIDRIDLRNLSEPKINIVDAVKTFRDKLITDNGADQNLINDMTKYILQKLVLVVVKTNSIYSAFRLFNVINARGMPLSNSDLLKSENLREINDSKEQDKYAKLWEDMEEEVGREEIEDLISFIRSIKLKEKAKSSIYEEFDKKVFIKENDFKGKPFIEYLNKVKNIYQKKLLDADITADDERKSTYYHNLVSLMYNYLPFKDWMIAPIRFSEKFSDPLLYDFIKKYEKRIAVDWVKGLSYTPRLSQIYRIVKLIENQDDAHDIFNSELLSIDEKEIPNLEDALNYRDFYKKGRWQVPKYVLLRLDLDQRNSDSVKINYGDNISVEHILPKRADADYWTERFDDRAQYEWKNRLGNLVPLNGRKNTRASNKAFTDKVEDYFDKKKNDFVLVEELKDYNDWNLDNLKERHNELIQKTINIWTNN